MPPNDVLALNLYYTDWCKARLKDGKAPRDLEPFELFVGEEMLKQYSLNDEELLRGLVGKSDDGGVDAFYFFINRVLADDSTQVDRRSENEIRIIIMQIRETKGFSPTALEKLERFTDDLLDLNKEGLPNYRYAYHKRLLDLMAVFKTKMKGMGTSTITLEYYFVTRCDEPPNDNCDRAARAIRATVQKHMPKADMKPFNFVGAQGLFNQTIIRRPSKKYISFAKSFDTPEGWVGVVPLRTFYEFLKDDATPDRLNETIFDDNVRGYYQNTPVNIAITNTLSAGESQPEFWLLNNGITILTPKIGLQGGRLELIDPQIVNGLQTSRRIFEYFKEEKEVRTDDTRRIVVRVIENANQDFRDQIIRATNNQNKMAAEALISTSHLHKQLDAYFESRGLYYDRRKGHYKDQGKRVEEIVSIITVVQSVVAILLGKPQDARGRPRDYVTKDEKRWQVFGHDEYGRPNSIKRVGRKPFELPVYWECVRIMRRVDEFIESSAQNLDPIEQRNMRFYLARYAACKLAGTAYCNAGDLVKASNKSINDSDLSEGLKIVKRLYRKHGEDDDAAKGKGMTSDLDNLQIKRFSPPNSSARRGRSKTRAV